MSAPDLPPPPPGPPAAQPCPRCGAPVGLDQDWCLSCGHAVTTSVAGAPGWRTPIMIVVAVITLATAALVFAFIQLSDDNNDKVASNPPPRPAAAAQTGPTGTSGPTGPETSLTGPTGPDDADPSATPSPDGTTTPDSSATPDSSTTPDASSTSTPSATSTPPDSVTGRSELTEWPTGKTAYTVIIYSGETRAQSEAKARSLNLPGLGILRSRDYSSLRAGYWVLWSGQYENLQQATAASKGLQSNAPGAYPKQVKPK